MEGNLMKKLITVSILSAALAASSAFAFDRDNSRDGFGGQNGGQDLSLFAPESAIKDVNWTKKDAVDQTAIVLRAIQDHMEAGNNHVKLHALNIKRNSRTDLVEGDLEFTGKVEAISNNDIRSIVQKMNKKASKNGGKVAINKGKLIVVANLSSSDLTPVGAFEIKQNRSQISVMQVRSDDKQVMALAKKLTAKQNIAKLKLQKISSKDAPKGKGPGF